MSYFFLTVAHCALQSAQYIVFLFQLCAELYPFKALVMFYLARIMLEFQPEF